MDLLEFLLWNQITLDDFVESLKESSEAKGCNAYTKETFQIAINQLEQ